MVLVGNKLNAHKGLGYDGILRSLGLYARCYWIRHPKLAPKVNRMTWIGRWLIYGSLLFVTASSPEENFQVYQKSNKHMGSFGILIISILCLSPGLAHEATDLEFILKSNPIEVSQQQQRIRSNFEETSELRLFSTGLIRLYQKFMSTQDLPLCNFTPSCSRFGRGVIKKYGLFRGLLLTADRLLRDHGMIWIGQYRVHPYTGKHFDPVEDYSPEAWTK